MSRGRHLTSRTYEASRNGSETGRESNLNAHGAQKTITWRDDHDEEQSMDRRIFNRDTVAWASDGTRMEKFKAGERVKNVQRLARGVFFEPSDPTRIAGTYIMEVEYFFASTDAVRQAGA